MAEFVSQTLALDGYDITSWEAGTGPVLLFLHGGGGAADMFAHGAAPSFLTDLAGQFRVIVPEHPGFGVRPRPEWLSNIHDLGYFYLDYLEMRGLTGVHLVGQSLGGWIAMELAVRDTSRLASLTLAGSPGIQVRDVPKGDMFIWSREEFAENMFHDRGAAQRYLDHAPTPDQQRSILRNRETTALLSWEPRMFDPHLYKWLHRIQVPTQVIWAAYDRLLPPAYGEALAKLLPKSRFVRVPDAGHLIHIDQPIAFAAAISSFIEESAV